MQHPDKCVCGTNLSCQTSAAIYETKMVNNEWNTVVSLAIPGLIRKCYSFDSFLFSTLECFFSNSSCFPILMFYLEKSFFYYDSDVLWIAMKPLVHTPTKNHFGPNTLLLTIVKELMIEQWNLNISFDHYYEACIPNSCSYSLMAHTDSFVRDNLKTSIHCRWSCCCIIGLLYLCSFEFLCTLMKPKIQRQSRGKSSSRIIQKFEIAILSTLSIQLYLIRFV